MATPDNHNGRNSEIDIHGPDGMRLRVRGYDILVALGFCGICLMAYIQWQSTGILKSVVASNDRQTVALSRLTCIMVAPVEQRPKELGRNSYCDSVAREALRDLVEDEEIQKGVRRNIQE